MGVPAPTGFPPLSWTKTFPLPVRQRTPGRLPRHAPPHPPAANAARHASDDHMGAKIGKALYVKPVQPFINRTLGWSARRLGWRGGRGPGCAVLPRPARTANWVLVVGRRGAARGRPRVRGVTPTPRVSTRDGGSPPRSP